MTRRRGKQYPPARLLVMLVTLAALIAGVALPVQAVSPHLKMGNPSHAVAQPQTKNNYLLEKPYYALSCNDSKGTPNWVSWRLTASDIGQAPRVQFYPDDALPAGFQRVTSQGLHGRRFRPRSHVPAQ